MLCGVVPHIAMCVCAGEEPVSTAASAKQQLVKNLATLTLMEKRTQEVSRDHTGPWGMHIYIFQHDCLSFPYVCILLMSKE